MLNKILDQYSWVTISSLFPRIVERRSGYRDCDHVQWEGSVAWQGRGGGRVVVNYYGILYNWLWLYDEGEIRVNTVQPSLVDHSVNVVCIFKKKSRKMTTQIFFIFESRSENESCLFMYIKT